MIDLPTNISAQDQARILSEVLPHMQQYDEETIVIKYGGHAMGEEDTAFRFGQVEKLLKREHGHSSSPPSYCSLSHASTSSLMYATRLAPSRNDFGPVPWCRQ